MCEYQESDHLCFFQGNQVLHNGERQGYGIGHDVIMDDQYHLDRTVQGGGGSASADMHEFHVSGETALLTTYQTKQYNLTAYNNLTELGWIMESGFEEINLTTDKVLFDWRSLDHTDLSESYTAADVSSGHGRCRETPWDYFHINSVDKNEDGDYLVSSRHAGCVYKVSGINGTILWRLNGMRSSFRLTNLEFSYQHHARFIEENSTTTILSVFDNGSDGVRTLANFSSGKIIAIDHETRTASMVASYCAPERLLSISQGSFQILANTNVFLGWGNTNSTSKLVANGTPIFSEHLSNGTAVLYASLATKQAQNYRAFKFNWTATPGDLPTLWTQADNRESQTDFHVSWNGATAVEHWNFYASSSPSGPFKLLTSVEKRGFETKYTCSKYHAWTFSEAVGKNRVSLGNSSITATYIPQKEPTKHCGTLYHPLTNFSDLTKSIPAPPVGGVLWKWLAKVVCLALIIVAVATLDAAS